MFVIILSVLLCSYIFTTRYFAKSFSQNLIAAALLIIFGTMLIFGLVKYFMREIQAREQVLLFETRHDPVTTLPNRRYFFEKLKERLQDPHFAKTPIAIITIGIHRFPQINHAIGHQIGDRLLHHVGAKLNQILSSELLARLASNVFIGIFPQVTSENYLNTVTQIMKIFETPFSVYTVQIDLDAIVGLSFFPQDGEDADMLVQKADLALYAARHAPERFALYRTEIDPRYFKLSLMSELREGLIQDELAVYYQPKILLSSKQVIDVEALIRWQHPTKGFMPPEKFIPLAEETGHIKKLTFWLIEKAIQQCSLWQQTNIFLKISLNLSVKDLLNPQLPTHVKALINAYKIDPTWITFEITESAFMYNPEEVIQGILKLKALNTRFAIDDFGTGYSSLNYLKRLPVHELKIDKDFIQDITTSERVSLIVQSTIELAHRLEMITVAEGVCDENTYHILKKLGCDIGQGYFFSKPLSLEEFTDWLSTSAWNICRLT